MYRVDEFAVPSSAREEFLDTASRTHALLRTQLGFVQDMVLEQSGGPGDFNFVTIVEWESSAAIESARAAVTAMHQQINLDPQEVVARLGVRADIASYLRLACAKLASNVR